MFNIEGRLIKSKRLLCLIFTLIFVLTTLVTSVGQASAVGVLGAENDNDNNNTSDETYSITTDYEPVDGEDNSYIVTIKCKPDNYLDRIHCHLTVNMDRHFKCVEESILVDCDDSSTFDMSYYPNGQGYEFCLGDLNSEVTVKFKAVADKASLSEKPTNESLYITQTSYFQIFADWPRSIKIPAIGPVNKRNVVINYYKDKVDDSVDENGNYLYYLGSDTEHFINQEVGSAIKKEDVPNKNTFIPDGYKENAEFATEFDENDEFIVSANGDENVINLVYKEKESYPYSVLYYKDSESDENLLKDISVIGEAEYDSEIPFNLEDAATLIEKFRPVGYTGRYSITYDAEHYTGRIQSFKNGLYNKVKIVYTKGVYPYKIVYYKDSISDGNKLKVVAYDDDSRVLEKEYLSVVPFSEVNKNLSQPEGYNEGVIIEESDTNTGLTITEKDNVINVLYTKKILPYTVNYYVEGEDEPFKTEEGEAEYESEIPYVDKTTDLGEEYEDILKGYDLDGDVEKLNEKGIVTTDPETNVINVTFKLKDVEYLVEYYKEVLDPETKEIKQEKISSYDGVSKYGNEFAYSEDDTQLDDENIINVLVNKEHPGDDYEDLAQKLLAPEKLGLTKEENTVKILYKLIVPEEIAADEDEVKPEEIAADEDEVKPEEVAADEEVIKPLVIEQEVAADSAEVNTADINAIAIRLLCVLMLGSILLVATVILNNKKKSL
ncbi:hypothetical protein [Lachnospira multipara]|uniref:Uncharacterized protein n=1 Tax=Lachnospira multipara TaxID=28051 RepID=A0A1H5X3S9_9FIRM|nr:hypothetical protein [Lachnospira multipara]SEG06065.1 hypothetical protein SAMN05216537_1219 [Lachnospira multipara]